jgi:hypothetical protein
MRNWILMVFVGLGVFTMAQQQQSKPPATLKSILLQQLRETHNQKNWFVSEKEAVGGLTAEQASWSDGKNHSAGQLLEHLNFWNSVNLAGLKKQPAPKIPDNNETFNFDSKRWETAQKDFDRIMTEIEQYVESADDATLGKIAPNIARIAQHNAYHIGEIVTSRKKQGSWDPEQGVK